MGGGAGVGGAGGSAGSRPLALEVYAESEDWGYLERTITIDSNDVIYLTVDHPKYAPAFRYARDLVVGMGHWLAGWID